jgi:hypothetical protein
MSDVKKSISAVSPSPSPIVAYNLLVDHHISYDDYNGRCLSLGRRRTAKEEAAEATVGTALARTYAFVSYCVGVPPGDRSVRTQRTSSTLCVATIGVVDDCMNITSAWHTSKSVIYHVPEQVTPGSVLAMNLALSTVNPRPNPLNGVQVLLAPAPKVTFRAETPGCVEGSGQPLAPCF